MRRYATTITITIALVVHVGAVRAQPAAIEPPLQPPGEAAPAAMPAMQPMPQPEPPPNSTRATFVSTSDMPWDVMIDRQPACTTPCSIVVVPLQYVVLSSREWRPVRLDVGYLPGGELTVAAEPLRRGKWAGGVVATTFSSMALATGITLTAVGCSIHDNTMCTGGVITGVVGAVGLYASIELMRSALPRVHVGAARPYATGSQVGLAGTF
jgi:hypothetical protein